MTNKEKKAQELLEALNLRYNMKKMIKAMCAILVSDQTLGLSLKKGKTTEEYVEKVSKVFDVEAMIYLLIPTYSKLYDTIEEFDIAIAFCESLIGKKLYVMATGISEESTKIIQMYLANHNDELGKACRDLNDEFLQYEE